MKQQTIAEKIYSILNRAAKTRYELATEVRKPVTSVCGVLKTLEDQGLVTSRKFCYQLHLSFLDRKRDLIGSKSKWRWRPSTERAMWSSRVVVLSPFLA